MSINMSTLCSISFFLSMIKRLVQTQPKDKSVVFVSVCVSQTVHVFLEGLKYKYMYF